MIVITSASASKIIVKDIEERLFTTSGLAYIIIANQKIFDLTKIKKIHLFNRKRIMSDSVFYKDGVFKIKNAEVSFEKGYFLDGEFIMINCSSNYNNSFIRSKMAKYKKTHIEFSGVVLKKDTKIYHKFKYSTEPFK